MKKKKSLGRGLDQIFGDNLDNLIDDLDRKSIEKNGQEVVEIKLDDILTNPYQPRNHFEEEKIKELADSINQHGLFTPILVRKNLTKYQLIAGERRYRAFKMLNKMTIPAIVVEYDELQTMEVALLENIQRENLNVIEEALAYKRLIDSHNYSQEELARRLGKSRPHITNLLRLLKLHPSIQEMVIDKRLSMGHIRSLITLDEDESLRFAQKAIEAEMSVRELEKLIKLHKNPQPKTSKKQVYSDINLLLSERLQTKVKVNPNNLNIYFKDQEDLNRILELLNLLEKED